jgi:hypothetical protein
MATFVDRLIIWVVPFLTGAFVLLRFIPGLLQFRFNMRLTRIYKGLETIEKAMSEGEDREELKVRLAEIEASTAGIRVPRRLIPPYFEMRQNIHDLGERLLRE